MLTGWKLKLSKWFLIPQRYVLGVMGFLAVVNAYNMRICLSVAITAMTIPINNNHQDPKYNDETCPSDYSTYTNGTSTPKHTYDWDSTTQGLILSSFFWGYVVTHLPGGILAEKFGGKHTVGLGILGTAIFTLLTPVVIKHGDWQWLIVIRILEGLGEGTTFPALNAMLAYWVPAGERSRIGTLVYSGGQIGTIIGTALSGVLIQKTGAWESVFYVFGGLAIVWYLVWTLICYSTPESHPFISQKELEYLNKELGGKFIKKKSIPWKGILTSLPIWALVAGQMGHDWGFFTMATDLPVYMSNVLKFKIAENGYLSSLPYIVMWIVSLCSAVLCDQLIKRNCMSVTFARKFFTTIGSVGPGIFIVAASYAGCDRSLVVILFCVAMGLMGTFHPGMKVNVLDLSSNFAGTVMAIVNGLGAISGIITPTLIGLITQNQTVSEWRVVFWISFVVFGVTDLIFILFGSGHEQWWNRIEPNSDAHLENHNLNRGQEK